MAVTTAVLVGISGLAFAQTVAIAGKSEIDLTQIIVALINLAFPAVAAVATLLINHYVKNQQMATLLSNAVQNGVGIVQKKTAEAVTQGHPTITLSNPDIASGVNYVLANAQEAVQHFNIPTARIADKIEAKIGLASIAANLATTANASPAIAHPLAPV
jgi:hypothetical protein